MTLTAIETRYKGYRFRSRLEARWAVFFDAMEWPWSYEAEGFHLGEAGAYLPDFRLDGRTFVEVKPTLDVLGDRDYQRYDALHRYTGDPVWIFAGTPGDHTVIVIDHTIGKGHLDGYGFAECRHCYAPAVSPILDGRWSMRCQQECRLQDTEYSLHQIIIAAEEYPEEDSIELAPDDFQRLLSFQSEWIIRFRQLADDLLRPCEYTGDAIADAIRQARGARFEFGESGGG